MSLKDYPDESLLSTWDVLKEIQLALKNKRPFSLVRIGDAENIIMAQRVFFTDQELQQLKWLNDPQYKTGERGVSLPNLDQRNRTVTSIRKGTIIGVCKQKHDDLIADESIKRQLTEKIFDHYSIIPNLLCHVFVNRNMVSKKIFWELLHSHRVLLISRWAKLYWDLIKRDYKGLRPQIAGWVDITNYNQVDDVLKRVGDYEFDLALISAGTSASILGPEIAERYGKVAVDFGHVMAFTLTKDPRVLPWKPENDPQKSPRQEKKRTIPMKKKLQNGSKPPQKQNNRDTKAKRKSNRYSGSRTVTPSEYENTSNGSSRKNSSLSKVIRQKLHPSGHIP